MWEGHRNKEDDEDKKKEKNQTSGEELLAQLAQQLNSGKKILKGRRATGDEQVRQATDHVSFQSNITDLYLLVDI